MFSKQEIIIFSLIIFAVLFTSIVAMLFGFPIAIGGFLLILISLITGKFPRTSFYLFLIYLCFGGTITYMIPGVYEKVGIAIRFSRIYIVLQFVKDVFYLPIVISILINHYQLVKEFIIKIKPLWYAILGFTSICFLTFLLVNIPDQFNPESGQKLASLMGIIGFKIWLSYIPVMLCTFFMIRNREDLTKLLRLQVILITACCLCETSFTGSTPSSSLFSLTFHHLLKSP